MWFVVFVRFVRERHNELPLSHHSLSACRQALHCVDCLAHSLVPLVLVARWRALPLSKEGAWLLPAQGDQFLCRRVTTRRGASAPARTVPTVCIRVAQDINLAIALVGWSDSTPSVCHDPTTDPNHSWQAHFGFSRGLPPPVVNQLPTVDGKS